MAPSSILSAVMSVSVDLRAVYQSKLLGSMGQVMGLSHNKEITISKCYK